MKQDIETMITMNDKNFIAHRRVILLLAVLCFALASCENRDYFHLPDGPDGTPIENPGRLHLSGIPAAHTAMLLDPAQGNRLVATISAGQPLDVEAGTYTLLYVSPAESASAQSDTGTANLRSDAGSASASDYSLDGLLLSLPLLTADGRLPQLPDIYTAGASITIRREQTHTFDLTPALLTRAVQLDVVLQGTDMDNIRSVEARLYGVSLTATLSFGINEITGTINPWKPGWNEGGTGI